MCARPSPPAMPPLTPWPVVILLALNILPELILQLADAGLLGPPWLRHAAYALGAFDPGLVAREAAIFPGQSLTMFFSYGVLHTGAMHLAINMIALLWLGRLVLLHRTGETFLTFYLIASIAAAQVFALLGSPGATMVGASGSLFGLMGLYAVDSGLLSRRPGLIGRIFGATLLLIMADLAGNLLLGTAVAWQAHAGGFLTGAALAMIYPPRQNRRR